MLKKNGFFPTQKKNGDVCKMHIRNATVATGKAKDVLLHQLLGCLDLEVNKHGGGRGKRRVTLCEPTKRG